MTKPIRIHLKALSQEAYIDEDNEDVMRKLNSEDVEMVVSAVLDKAREKLQDGTNVYLDGFGSLQVKHPKIKTIRAFDIAKREVVDHRKKSKINFKACFSVEGSNNG